MSNSNNINNKKNCKRKKIILWSMLALVAISASVAIPITMNWNKEGYVKKDDNFGLKEYSIDLNNGKFLINCESHDSYILSYFKLFDKDGQQKAQLNGPIFLKPGIDEYAEVAFNTIDILETTSDMILQFKADNIVKKEITKKEISGIKVIVNQDISGEWKEFKQTSLYEYDSKNLINIENGNQYKFTFECPLEYSIIDSIRVFITGLNDDFLNFYIDWSIYSSLPKINFDGKDYTSKIDYDELDLPILFIDLPIGTSLKNKIFTFTFFSKENLNNVQGYIWFSFHSR